MPGLQDAIDRLREAVEANQSPLDARLARAIDNLLREDQIVRAAKERRHG